MAVITTGNFQKLLLPGIRKLFGDEYKDMPVLYPMYMDVVKSTRNFEEDTLYSGLGLGKIKPEGSAIQYDDTSQQYTKRYTNVTYANGFIITREMMEDGVAPFKAERLTKSLARGMVQTKDIVAANVMNRAFNSSYTGGDGKELCATDHPTLSSDLRNELSTAADLSEASLEQAIIDLSDFRDHRGLRMHHMPKKLLVPKELRFEARRILGSEGRVGVADNDLNAIKSLGDLGVGDVIVNNYLTDTDAWFIITDVPDGLKFQVRREMEIGTDNDFDTENAKFKATMRFDTGWTDPRGVFGSPGAA
jgi:phage major head subunit gpT-like protein